jgi:aminoglycoside phosphotransferase (APT) family kinase protein
MMCNPDPALGRPTATAMPSNNELLSAYQRQRGSEVSDMNWFHALVRFKQAAISALVIRNARKRGDTPPFHRLQHLLQSARTFLNC